VALKLLSEAPSSEFTVTCQEEVSNRKVSYSLPLAQWRDGLSRGKLIISDNTYVVQPDGNLAEGIVFEASPLSAEVSLTLDSDNLPQLAFIKLDFGRTGTLELNTGVEPNSRAAVSANMFEFHFEGTRSLTCSPFLSAGPRPGIIVSN
jgi:hypothetical protein